MKKWIPVNENGQLWKYSEQVEDMLIHGYAVVLNNKPFVLRDQFHTIERTWFRTINSIEVAGHREIIYLV